MFRLVLNESIKGLWKEFSFTKHPFPQRQFNSSDYEKQVYYVGLDKTKQENRIKHQDGFTLIFDVGERGQAKLWLPNLKNEYAEGNHLYGSGRGMQALTLSLDVYAYGVFLELLSMVQSEGFNFVDIEYTNDELILHWDNAKAVIKNAKQIDMVVPATKKPPYQPMKYHLYHTKQRGCVHILSKKHNIFATNTGTCLKVTRNVPIDEYDFDHINIPQRTDGGVYEALGVYVEKVDTTKPLPEMDLDMLINRLPKTGKMEYFHTGYRMYVDGYVSVFPFVYQDTQTDAYGFGYISILVDDKTGLFVRELTRWCESDSFVILGFIQMDMLDTINKFDNKNKASGYKGLKLKDLYGFGIADLEKKYKTAFVILDNNNLILSPMHITHQVNGEPEYWYKVILDIMPHTLV